MKGLVSRIASKFQIRSSSARVKDIQAWQVALCRKYQADYQSLNLDLKLGISANFFDGAMPLNGLRLQPEGDTCGWYLWAGQELSRADDFFQPLHVYHLIDSCPHVLPYLALPPGWRFLTDGTYEDVWFDANLEHD
jgi:hypothetical protein